MFVWGQAPSAVRRAWLDLLVCWGDLQFRSSEALARVNECNGNISPAEPERPRLSCGDPRRQRKHLDWVGLSGAVRADKHFQVFQSPAVTTLLHCERDRSLLRNVSGSTRNGNVVATFGGTGIRTTNPAITAPTATE